MNGKLILGIDEAGRGAHVGPLVVAGVLLTPDTTGELLAHGLRDSKRLAASGRRALVDSICRLASWIGVEVRSAAIVDQYVARIAMKRRTTLNALERRMASALIRRAPGPDSIIADGFALFGSLRRRFPTLLAEDHADTSRPSVMAAALVAKAERDRLLGEIDRRARSLCGSIPRKGYPGVTTTAWIERYQQFFGELPPEVRRSWGSRPAPTPRQ